MKTCHTCIIGDSRKMGEIDTSTVHLVVTSPPYWQLKDYGADNQIGFDHSYEEYINNLNLVWDECFRVLHPGCRMVVNIGDQFARAAYYGRYKVIPIRTEIIKFCESIGFDYMGAIIWQKKTTMNTTGGASIMGSFPYPRNGIVEIDYEFILLFKKPGDAPKPTREQKEKSIIPKETWKEYFSGHWTFGGARQDDHIAVFPTELPKRAIEMFTFTDETVLDPFYGSGTTSVAAILTGRNSVGYEINEQFLPIIEKKVGGYGDNFFNDFEFIVKKQIPLKNVNWKEEIRNLNYIFTDPMKFDKKIDPQKLKFGSKITFEDSRSGAKREEYHTVREILGGNSIALDNGLVVRLLGVKPMNGNKENAVNFLKNKILKQQVFLKFDTNKYDDANTLLAYVYLKNKTFINAHLIKHGFAGLDDEIPFGLMEKFERIEKMAGINENAIENAGR